MNSNHRVIIGDSRKMEEVHDETIHLVITSPPYWQLKDYGDENQLGYNDTYEEYINNLNLVWNECHRVLKQGCRLCINIGDQFARSVYYGRYKVIPIRTEIIKFCESIGFDYMGAIIWQKVTTTNTTGGATIMGSYPFPRNGILKIDYEFILIFKKYGKSPKVSRAKKEKSRMTKEEWNKYFVGHWNFPGVKQNKHLAMFPEELPKRLIKMFSFVGDTILDPFLGSGTTSLVAKKLNRNSVGYEINNDFLSIIKTKLGINNKTLFDDKEITFKIVNQKERNLNVNEVIKKFPYKFKDPIRFDKKINPKLMRFGSKIDNSDYKREKYYSVTEVISPEVMILSNNLKIRLIGIKEAEKKKGEAIDFLNKKVKGQKVYLKYDSIKYDPNNNLFCYLYLKNKTFINAHLIKRGLVYVDRKKDYKHKSRFLNYLSLNGV